MPNKRQNANAADAVENANNNEAGTEEIVRDGSTAVIRGLSTEAPEAEENNGSLLQQARNAVHRANESERVKNQALQQEDIVNEASLRTAVSRRRIFQGPITAIEELRDGDNVEVAAVVMLSRTVKIMIPFSKLFTRDPLRNSVVRPEDETPIRLVQRKRQFSERMIGSNVQFIITELYTDSDIIICLGDRAQAMRTISERAFGGDRPRFKVGDLIETKITSVSVHALTTYFEGVDTIISMSLLTRRWILDLRDEYRVGDSLYARIRGIRKDENGVYSLQLDTIAVELEDALDHYHVIADGARTRAIITAVFKTQDRPGGQPGASRIFAWIPGYDLPVRVVRLDSNTFGRPISAGTEVIVRVNRHADDGYLVCEAIYDYGNNSMFSQGRYR